MVTPQLTFTQAVSQAFGNLTKFSGRSRRSEFWWVMLLYLGVNICCTPLVGFAFGLLTIPLAVRRLHDTGRSGWWLLGKVVFPVLLSAWVLCLFACGATALIYTPGYPASAALCGVFIVTFVLWALFALVYQVALIVFLCQDGDPEANRYGPSPKHTPDIPAAAAD